MEDLTSAWAGWLKEHQETGCPSFCLNLETCKRQMLQNLRKKGFAVPARRGVRTSLETDVEPLVQTTRQKGGPVNICTFWHLLNMLWQPILTYLEDLLNDRYFSDP